MRLIHSSVNKSLNANNNNNIDNNRFFPTVHWKNNWLYIHLNLELTKQSMIFVSYLPSGGDVPVLVANADISPSLFTASTEKL